MKKILFLIAFATIGFTFQATAQKKINHKIDKICLAKNAKINNGARCGTINKKEAAILRTQNRQLTRTTKIAAADGKITRREKAVLTTMNKNLNRNIRIAKS